VLTQDLTEGWTLRAAAPDGAGTGTWPERRPDDTDRYAAEQKAGADTGHSPARNDTADFHFSDCPSNTELIR